MKVGLTERTCCLDNINIQHKRKEVKNMAALETHNGGRVSGGRGGSRDTQPLKYRQARKDKKGNLGVTVRIPKVTGEGGGGWRL